MFCTSGKLEYCCFVPQVNLRKAFCCEKKELLQIEEEERFTLGSVTTIPELKVLLCGFKDAKARKVHWLLSWRPLKGPLAVTEKRRSTATIPDPLNLLCEALIRHLPRTSVMSVTSVTSVAPPSHLRYVRHLCHLHHLRHLRRISVTSVTSITSVTSVASPSRPSPLSPPSPPSPPSHLRHLFHLRRIYVTSVASVTSISSATSVALPSPPSPVSPPALN